MATGAKGYIVDTNILVSKKLKMLQELDAKLYVTATVVLEYMNWIIHQRNQVLGKGEIERAKGYERLLQLFPRLLEALGIEVISEELRVEDLREAAELVLRRGVDPGDAIIALAAKQHGLGIVSGDQDWERLRDYVSDWVKP